MAIENQKNNPQVEDKTLKSWPASERPRERLIHCGAHVLSDAELLAILLRTGVEGCSVVDLARKLLSSAGGLRALLSMTEKEFTSFHGMGSAKYAQLQACLEMSKRVLLESMDRVEAFSGSEQTKDYLSLKLRDKEHEVFAALFLDSRHQLLGYKELFRGSINSASVPIREVVKESMQYNAASIVVAHNHPSGVAEPSISDKNLTESLVKALSLVDVRLLDHIVVGDTECWSFAERGLL